MTDIQSSSPLKKLWRLAIYIGFGIIASLALSSAALSLLFNTDFPSYFHALQTSSAEWLPSASRFLAALQQFFTFFIPGIIFYRHYRTKGKGLHYSQKIFLYVVALNILSIPLVEFAYYINQFFPSNWLNHSSRLNNLFIEQMLIGDGYGTQALNVLILCLLPAIGEELVFRFGLQKHILSNTNLGSGGAIIITSIVFSFIHFEMSAFLPRLVLALVLGTSYLYSKTLFVPILFHFFNNYLAYMQMKFGSENGMFPEYIQQNTLLTVSVVVGCSTLMVILFLQLKKISQQPIE